MIFCLYFLANGISKFRKTRLTLFAQFSLSYEHSLPGLALESDKFQRDEERALTEWEQQKYISLIIFESHNINFSQF